MEQMPLLYLILYSIPESIVLVSLGGFLYGYDVLKNIRRVLILATLLASFTLIARYLPFGQNVLVEIPVFIALTSLILRTPIKISSLLIFTPLIICAITQNIYFAVLTGIMHLNLSVLMSNLWPRLLMSWVYLLQLSGFTALVVKKDFTVIRAIEFFKIPKSNKRFLLLVLTLLSQALLAGVLQMAATFEQSQAFPIALNNSMLQRMIGISLVTIPVISIFILKRVFSLSQKEAIIATQETYLNNINNLFVTIRGQRHDFVNNVQVIYSLLKSNQVDEALKYMDNLLDDIQEVNELIKTKDPALSALLNTKQAIAERHNIDFSNNIEASMDGSNIKSLDLVKILGNLLDNAFDAVLDQPAGFKKVTLSIKGHGNLMIFEVFNPRPVIPPEHLDDIFTGGYSTKTDQGHSGLGLAVVKEIIGKYNGQIGVKSTEEEGTTFTVVIPK